jgi:hypothetical protein
MNKKILGVFVGVFVVVMLATPMVGTVMAIGPVKAVEVGKNPKIAEEILPMGVAFLDDVGPNNIMWVNALSLIISLPDARKGSGRMNNAIIANHDTLVDMQINPEMYDNKLVYLSGTGGEQWDARAWLSTVLMNVFPLALQQKSDHPRSCLSDR